MIALSAPLDAEARRGRGRGGDAHDEVWRGRQAGTILPLEAILATLPEGARRRIVEVEFDYDDGIPVYEIEYVDEYGRLIEVEIDARNGVVLKQEYD